MSYVTQEMSLMNNTNQLITPRNHLIGWIVIVGKSDKDKIKITIDQGLNSFFGDYGLIKEIRTNDGFGFGLWKPDTPLPLTTWSFFNDKDNCCFIEGVLYDDFFSYQPKDGEDQQFAEIFLKKFRESKAKSIEQLNGCFCGFIFDYRTKKLITFVDRLGVRILYWSYEKGNLIVSSNLAAFRNLKTLSIDESAAFQFLTIGFPIDERTLLKDVMLQLPCTMNIYDGPVKESVRYWDVPKRMKNSSLEESVEMISLSMEDHLERIYQRTKQKVGLGLTGGHDSRVILNALVYRDIPFVPVIWKDNNFNDEVVSELCFIIKKQPIIVKNVSCDELTEIKENVFTYSDGLHLHFHGFVRLAKECVEERIKCLILGFSGDKISGSLTIPAPQYLRNIKKLALCTLRNQMELLSFKNAHLLIRNISKNIIKETTSEWMQSFIKESSHEYLSDISIWQGFANRNLKRIRFSMIPALQYVQTIFPYSDNKVLNAYFSLPLKFLNNQKAHCYAGFSRFKDFGNYQACSYPISLKEEAFSPFGLYLLRLSRLKLKNLLSMFQSSGYKGGWPENDVKIYDEISQSSLFNANFLKELFVRKKIVPEVLYIIHTLSRFYDFYICGNNRYVPQRFLHR
jgi:asparagine synthetase B (glutamine-hydrolysing)